jgi:hypothetical protein
MRPAATSRARPRLTAYPMHPTLRFGPSLAVVMVLFLLTAGCNPAPSPVSIKSKQEFNGPPDLVKGTPWDARWHAYQLRAFQMNHVWTGPEGLAPAGEIAYPYRLKVTVWDFADDGSAVAELFFHDGPTGGNVGNPDPKDAKRPYQLHFPASAIGPILQALRNANEPLYLYYYENLWAIGIGAPEPVGVD